MRLSILNNTLRGNEMCVATNYLSLSWSTSRGADTYGYNICRLDADKRYRCMGGGYDMVGTVVANWLKERYQERLVAAGSAVTGLYGARKQSWGVSLDGACGLECMIQIAEAIGIRITQNYNRRARRTDGFFVTDYGSAEALKLAA
jgi:hypothetical protein